MSEQRAYIGRNKDGFINYAIADVPENRSYLAVELARIVRAGGTVQRVPADWMRRHYGTASPYIRGHAMTDGVVAAMARLDHVARCSKSLVEVRVDVDDIGTVLIELNRLRSATTVWREVTFVLLFGIVLPALLAIVLPALVVFGGRLFGGVGDAFGLW